MSISKFSNTLICVQCFLPSFEKLNLLELRAQEKIIGKFQRVGEPGDVCVLACYEGVSIECTLCKPGSFHTLLSKLHLKAADVGAFPKCIYKINILKIFIKVNAMEVSHVTLEWSEKKTRLCKELS